MKYLSLFLLFFTASVLTADDRPNFIMFIADDVSFNDFGCYGHPKIKTPNVDSLAQGGMVFHNAYLTTSSCSPSRTSIITSRYPHNTGAPELHQQGMDPNILDLYPRELKKAGYYCAQSGKLHINGPVDSAFDKIYSGKEAGKTGSDRWVKCIQEAPKDKPFFMWFASKDAHRAWEDPQQKAGTHSLDDVIIPPYMFDGPQTREDLKKYYNEVQSYDRAIGNVVAELKKQGRYENTVIFILADNGRPFPRDKNWLYDSGIKTPFVVHWPKGLKGKLQTTSLISVLDIGPTFLDLAGLTKPEMMQGVSFKKLLNDPNATVRDFTFSERNWHDQRGHTRMVRWKNFAYMRNNRPELLGFNVTHHKKGPSYIELAQEWKKGTLNKAQLDVFQMPRPSELLFDLSKDPDQLNDLSKNSEMKEVVEKLRKVMDRWEKETADTVPLADDMTPDRHDKDDWSKINFGKLERNDYPGKTTKAQLTKSAGPIFDKE
ncbi:MAG: sulfatase [Lentisphaeraceae bacterium]|nr:sulfatase [Lentisphaeraceae bacterium]